MRQEGRDRSRTRHTVLVLWKTVCVCGVRGGRERVSLLTLSCNHRHKPGLPAPSFGRVRVTLFGVSLFQFHSSARPLGSGGERWMDPHIGFPFQITMRWSSQVAAQVLVQTAPDGGGP